MAVLQVTVSTVGLVDKLEVFAARPDAPQLALSLHATTDEVGQDWKQGRGTPVWGND